MGRTYSKILKVLGDDKLNSRQILEKFFKVFGYRPAKKTIWSDLSRAAKEGILTRDENGFYNVNK